MKMAVDQYEFRTLFQLAIANCTYENLKGIPRLLRQYKRVIS